MGQVKVTSAEVARRAGVSQSAVSRVFTPGASASAKTIAKVRKAAEELGYRPNVLARAVVSGRSRIIGLAVAYLENQFYPLALELLSRALKAKGYHLLVFMVPNDKAEIDKAIWEMMDYQVEGIITASVSIDLALSERCMAAGIPVVMFNRGQDGSTFSSVTSANVEGGRTVARFLAKGGHRRIAHIAGWQGSSTGRDRALGFRQGLEAAGTTLIAEIDGMYNRETAAEAARRLMDRPDAPDAIFVGNDHMAFAVMDVLRFELGLRVPDDVSVVGYDDVPLADWGAYRLTSVRQPVNRMVDATVETLMAQIEDPERPTQKIEINGPLIVRQSARIPEGWRE
jgi:DNA-binding LacI/PurR family transcriptional regulator